MKNIRTKLTFLFATAALIVGVISGLIGVLVTNYSTESAIQANMTEMPGVAAMAAQNSISTYTFVMGEIATNPVLTSTTVSHEEKDAFVKAKAAAYYMRTAGYADVNGQDPVNGRDLSKEPFFVAAMAGNTYMSTPYVNAAKDDAHLAVGVPVRSDDGTIIGVAYFHCDTFLLQTIIADLQIGDNGFSYILDKEGTVIASKDQTEVFNKKNAIVENGSSAQAAAERLMLSGESGITSYKTENDTVTLAYAPIPSTDGWSIGIAISDNEFTAPARKGNTFQVGIILVVYLIILVIAFVVSDSIAKAIVQCEVRLRKLAEGDLTSDVPKTKRKDEIGALAKSTAHIVETLRDMLGELMGMLSGMSGGDLTIKEIKSSYPGDFAALQENLEVVNLKFNQIVSGIADAANHVSVGAEEVSSSSSSLSQGASDQARTVEELSATAREISNVSTQTAALSVKVCEGAQSAGAHLAESNEHIKHLNDAMKNITESSDEIGKIIATIENIAFQTNILALNAAVEAARAGDVGKGFAVVAEEVRTLATRSDQAAKATKELIEGSMRAVTQGSSVVEKVTESISEVITLAGESVANMQVVAEAVEGQNNTIQSMITEVESLSDVVITTSAMADESAAASQELSDQADTLKQLIGGFKVN